LSYRFTLNANFREANKENQIKDTNNNNKKRHKEKKNRDSQDKEQREDNTHTRLKTKDSRH